MKFKIFTILLLLFASSCSAYRVVDVKSPCVSNNDGPCGVRKPVNDWWLKQDGLKS